MAEELYGNPWILKDIYNYLIDLETNSDYEQFNTQLTVTPIERLSVIKEHLDLLIKEKGEYIAIREMRKHICWYVKNLKESTKVKEIINRLETKQEVIDCLTEYFETI